MQSLKKAYFLSLIFSDLHISFITLLICIYITFLFYLHKHGVVYGWHIYDSQFNSVNGTCDFDFFTYRNINSLVFTKIASMS